MERTITEQSGYKYVSYPKTKISRNGAWLHLLQNSPPGVSICEPLKDNNPYRKNHTDDSWCWRVLPPEETDFKEDSEVAFYDPKVWKSVSHKYRTVARLPDGMTGKEALQWANTELKKIHGAYHQDFRTDFSDADCARTFMRCCTSYSFAEQYSADLSRSEWDLFKKSGGTSC